MVGLGSLKSPLPDYELIMKAIRELWETCQSHSEVKKALSSHDIQGFLGPFQVEIKKIGSAAKKLRAKILRLEETLKSVDTTLKNYKSKLKKAAKKDDSIKPQLEVVDSLLKQVKNLKREIKDEAGRAAIEEGNLAANV